MNDADKVDLWKQRFFEAQAAAEEFVLATHGQSGLDEWTRANARITADLLASQRPPDQSRGDHFASRLRLQLALYDSDVDQTCNGPQTIIDNQQCGILRYRKEAAAKGVNLTFARPCGYCQQLNTLIYTTYTSEQTPPACELTEAGCVWTIPNE